MSELWVIHCGPAVCVCFRTLREMSLSDFFPLPRLQSLFSEPFHIWPRQTGFFLFEPKENLVEGSIFSGCLLDFFLHLSISLFAVQSVLVKCCYILLWFSDLVNRENLQQSLILFFIPSTRGCSKQRPGSWQCLVLAFCLPLMASVNLSKICDFSVFEIV